MAQAISELKPDRASALEIRGAGELAARIASAPPRRWLFRGAWPEGTYGVLAAPAKAQKSWDIHDAAVSVASGTPWLDAFPCEFSGPVLLFLGEGGAENAIRRLQAISAFKGVALDDAVRICLRVPHLTNTAHLDAIDSELETHPAALVGIDPLYLAARGQKAGELVAMGAALEDLQHIGEKHCAALMVAHHHNRGEGHGPERMSGAGPAEWGRVLVNARVERRQREADGTTIVTRALSFVGTEIPDTSLRLRRRIRAADPNDLSSPFEYGVEVLPADESDDEASSIRPAAKRVLRVLERADYSLTVGEIQTRSGSDETGRGHLATRTVQVALAELEGLGLAMRKGEIGVAAQWTCAPKASNAV